MGKYTTDPLRTGREIEKADGLGTLGGEFGLCWNDTVPLTTGAHNAFCIAKLRLVLGVVVHAGNGTAETARTSSTR